LHSTSIKFEASLRSHTYFQKKKEKNEKKKKKESHISGGAWRFVKVFGVLFDTY
jgi:hypothetical protein